MSTSISPRPAAVRPHRGLARTTTAVRLALFAGLLAGLAGGCGTHSGSAPARQAAASGGGAFPVAVAAVNGTVRIAKRPVAIVSLSPTATEMLYAIGAGPQVKAVDSLSDYPRQAPRTALSAYNPNIEAIVAEKPDLVVASNDIGLLTRRLAAFSVPVLALPAPSNLSGVYTQFRELGQATGHERQAGVAVSALRATIARIVAAAPHRTRPLTYYYELDPNYYSLTSKTFVGSLFTSAGLTNIADASSASNPYPQLSAEVIVKQNPDLIFLADTKCCGQSAQSVGKRAGWNQITAVQNGQVIALDDDIASRWGPRIVDLFRAITEAAAKAPVG